MTNTFDYVGYIKIWQIPADIWIIFSLDWKTRVQDQPWKSKIRKSAQRSSLDFTWETSWAKYYCWECFFAALEKNRLRSLNPERKHNWFPNMRNKWWLQLLASARAPPTSPLLPQPTFHPGHRSYLPGKTWLQERGDDYYVVLNGVKQNLDILLRFPLLLHFQELLLLLPLLSQPLLPQRFRGIT